jgi:class 3 adenylate cyclase
MTLRRSFATSFAAILVLIAASVVAQLWVERRREGEIARLQRTPIAADEADAHFEDRLHWVPLLFSGSAAVLVLAVAGFGLRRLSRGFTSLRRGATALVDEDLHSPLEPRSGDEFGEVAGVMSSLAYDLALTQRHLTVANRELEKRNREIERQRQISDSLLRNILPGEVAEELSRQGRVQPRAFEDVTILFTDFVGFTPSTEHMPAQDLVQILHDYFTDFDRIARRFRLEKLKTIGDSYMCAGGLPARGRSHPVDAVMAALEMLRAVQEKERALAFGGWSVRIGIHTGPVIAGVVGIDKFAFDVWGETVNFSSRVESAGAPNRINLSAATHARIEDFFECEPRGKVRTKENREFDMYFVRGLRPELLIDGQNAPSPEFRRRYQQQFRVELPAFPAFSGESEETP